MRGKPMRNYRTLALAIVLSALVTTQAGCLLLAVGAGTGVGVAYVAGKSEAMLDATPKQVAAAAELAVKDLDMTLISSDSSGVDSKVIARTSRDVKYTIVAESAGEKSSHVYIRVGVFGDDEMQYQMLDKIKAHLPEAVASAKTAPSTTQPAAQATGTQTATARD